MRRPGRGAVPVRRTVARLVVVLAAVVLGVGVTAVVAVVNVRNEVTQYRTQVTPLVDTSQTIRFTLVQAQTDFRGYLLSRDPALLTRFEQGRVRLGQLHDQLATSAPGLVSADVVESLVDQDREWFALADSVLRSVRDGGAASIAVTGPAFEHLMAAYDSMTKDVAATREVRRAQYDRAMVVAMFATAVVVALALALALIVGRRLTSRLVEPLQRLGAVVEAHENSRTEVRADANAGPAEVAAVAAAFNAMADANDALNAGRLRDLDLHRATGRVAGLLATMPSAGGAWTPACEVLGEALAADRALVYARDDSGRLVCAGSWSLDPAHDDAGHLGPVDEGLPGGIGSVVEHTLVADTPAAIRSAFPAPLAAIADDGSKRAWILSPIRVGGQFRGALSVWSTSERGWSPREVAATDRFAWYAGQTIQEADYVESLLSLDRQKTDFLATTSHELRTPLTSLQGYVELLEGGDFGDLTAGQRKAVDVVSRNVVRLRQLIDNLLTMGQLDSGGPPLRRGPVDLTALTNRVLDTLAPLAARQDVSLSLESPAGEVVVDADAEQLERAVLNVVGNAVKFSRAGGAVTVSVSVDDDAPEVGDAVAGARARIRCRDQGIGIPQHDLPRLGTSFFRADNARRDHIPGTGLGLAIVGAVLAGHGGSVGIDSTEGVGTTVTLEIPVHAAAPVPARV